MTGDTGPKGDDGDTGPAGAPGDDGAFAEGLVSATLYCGAALQNTTLYFAYWATVFADGTVWASGEIQSPYQSTSGSRVYAPTQNGAATAAVSVVRDSAAPDNSGWWQISLNRQTLVVSVTYNDVDVTNGQLLWTLDSDTNNCVVNQLL